MADLIIGFCRVVPLAVPIKKNTVAVKVTKSESKRRKMQVCQSLKYGHPIGGDALPFQAGKVGRTTFSFVPDSTVGSPTNFGHTIRCEYSRRKWQ